MGQISVPKLLPVYGGKAPIQQLRQGVERFVTLLERGSGQTVVISGAGISVDSGIRAYRGERGSYSINKTYRPIFYNEFVSSSTFRQRYWARSYLGYTPVQIAEPNIGHFALAALMRLGLVKQLITQNVDRLHHKASALGEDFEPDSFLPHPQILELHGTLKHVHCIDCGHLQERDKFQLELSKLNPAWSTYADAMVKHGTEPRTNPDGDVDLQNKSYDDFTVPDCSNCHNGILKPTVTFFGESLTEQVRSLAKDTIEQCRNVVVLGSALATFSAFRLVKDAKDSGKEVGLVNLGVTRADAIVDWKIGTSNDQDVAPQVGCSELLRAVGEEMIQLKRQKTGSVDSISQRMLSLGVTKSIDGGREREPTS